MGGSDVKHYSRHIEGVAMNHSSEIYAKGQSNNRLFAVVQYNMQPPVYREMIYSPIGICASKYHDSNPSPTQSVLNWVHFYK